MQIGDTYLWKKYFFNKKSILSFNIWSILFLKVSQLIFENKHKNKIDKILFNNGDLIIIKRIFAAKEDILS